MRLARAGLRKSCCERARDRHPARGDASIPAADLSLRGLVGLAWANVRQFGMLAALVLA